MPLPRHLRPLLAVVVGCVTGGLLHRAVVETTGTGPVGWRVVSQPKEDAVPAAKGPRRLPGSWVLEQQQTWFARTSLPGQRLRTIELDATLPERGQLDIWLTRQGIDLPFTGDMVLRIDRFAADRTNARVFTWAPDGPHRVSCSPPLRLGAAEQVDVRAQLTDGLLEVWLGGEASVCAVIGGSDPPALQAGHHRVRVKDLRLDGRPVHAPHPGSAWVWAALGAIALLTAGRIERATGATWAMSLAGDALLLSACGLALLASRRLEQVDVAVVACVLGCAVLLRAALHLGRAMRPLPGTGDWTHTAALAAVLPALGLLFLAKPDLDGNLPFAAFVLGSLVAAFGLPIAWGGRRRKWRAIAMMGGLVSSAALLGAVVGGASLAAIGAASLAGGGLAVAVGGLSRVDHPVWRRTISALMSLVAMACALEVSTVSMMRVSDHQHQNQRPSLAAPVAPLPSLPEEGILFTGPFAPDGQGPNAAARVLHAQLQRPVHRVGDVRWGVSELLASMMLSGDQLSAGAVVMTVGTLPEAGGSKRRPLLRARTGQWFVGTLALARQALQPRDASVGELTRQLKLVHAGLQARGIPLLVVLGPSGPDPAPLDGWRQAIAQASADGEPINSLDIGAKAHASDEPIWLDGRGFPSDHAWSAVVERLRPMLD